MDRGILSTIYVRSAGYKVDDIMDCWKTRFADSPFVNPVDHLPSTKHVSGTNFVQIDGASVRRANGVGLCDRQSGQRGERCSDSKHERHVRSRRKNGAGITLTVAIGRPLRSLLSGFVAGGGLVFSTGSGGKLEHGARVRPSRDLALRKHSESESGIHRKSKP